MKIDNSSTSSLPLSSSGDAKARAPIAKAGDNAPSAAATAASVNSTSVNLGTTSAQLRSLGGSATDTPVNATKVAEIKKAISEGRFQVNSSAVADSLINSVTDLIASHQA